MEDVTLKNKVFFTFYGVAEFFNRKNLLFCFGKHFTKVFEYTGIRSRKLRKSRMKL